METRTLTRFAVADTTLSCLVAELPRTKWLAAEAFLAEEPRVKDWLQSNASGQFILLTNGFEQVWRYRVCFPKTEYLSWFKRVVRYAVEEVNIGFIHFDNFVAEVDW
jgi:hypothetical protein